METSSKHQAVLDIQDLSFSWQSGQNPLFEIPSLQLAQKENIFLFGPSGSGKSTLLNIICGILPPSSGQVAIQGQNLYQLGNAKRDRFRSEHIGLIFQQLNLIPYLSMAENVLLPAFFANKANAQVESRATSLLSSLGFERQDFTQPASQLSVGQQQRVAIARALLLKPFLVVADEPTSSLDADNRDSFMQLLLNEAKENNSSVIFVSHDKALASHFKREIDMTTFKERAIC